MSYAEPLCRKVEEMEIPPFRAINHTIPLIDEQKVYQWRPSKCPEVFRSQRNEKRDVYQIRALENDNGKKYRTYVADT